MSGGDVELADEQEMIPQTDGSVVDRESSTAKAADGDDPNNDANNNKKNSKGSSKFFELFRFGSRSSNDDTDDENEPKNGQNGIQEKVFGNQSDSDSGDESDGDDYVGNDIQDIADSLRDAQLVIPDTGQIDHEEDDQKEGSDETEHDDKGESTEKSKDDFWGNAMKMILGGGADDDGESLSSAVAFARAAVAASQGEMAETKAAMSPDEWLKLSRVLLKQLDVAFGEIPVNKIDPVAFPYYLESQDAKKNPSWKRRLHRFMPGVPKETIFGLHDALYLSQLAYVDTVEEVQDGLETYIGAKFELVFCTTESTPVVPAHFLVVKKEPKSKRSHKPKSWSLPWSKNKHDDHQKKEYVEIVLSIRGTKTVEDMFSDALLECTEYRGGKAHDGVCASGISIVEKHTDLILRILKMSGRKKVRLTLLGHSLGAGAASIACIEFNENHPDIIEADCIGFGWYVLSFPLRLRVSGFRPVGHCDYLQTNRFFLLSPSLFPHSVISPSISFHSPALLSLELSEKWKDKITTVVNDADMVVRMSGATVANLLMDVLEFHYQETLMEDVKQVRYETKDIVGAAYHPMGSTNVHSLFLLLCCRFSFVFKACGSCF